MTRTSHGMIQDLEIFVRVTVDKILEILPFALDFKKLQKIIKGIVNSLFIIVAPDSLPLFIGNKSRCIVVVGPLFFFRF